MNYLKQIAFISLSILIAACSLFTKPDENIEIKHRTFIDMSRFLVLDQCLTKTAVNKTLRYRNKNSQHRD